MADAEVSTLLDDAELQEMEEQVAGTLPASSTASLAYKVPPTMTEGEQREVTEEGSGGGGTVDGVDDGGGGHRRASSRTVQSITEVRKHIRLGLGSAVWLRNEALTGQLVYDKLLNPLHPIVMWYDRWILLLCIYVAFAIPVLIFFQIELCPGQVLWAWELVVDTSFFIDIGMKFVTRQTNEDGDVVLARISMARQYVGCGCLFRKREITGTDKTPTPVMSWFLADSLSVVPSVMGYIFLIQAGGTCGEGVVESGQTAKFFKLLRLLRILKLLRLQRLRKWWHRYSKTQTDTTYIKLLAAMLSILYTCHIIASMWFYIGTLGMDAGEANPDGWLVAAGINTTEGEHQTPLRDQYQLRPIHRAHVGFGDITPKTWEEKLFAIIAELFGCMLFATLIGGLGGIFGASPLNRKVGQQLDELRDWSLSHVNLDPRLHKELADIMEKAYQRDVFSEAQLFARLEAEKELHIKERLERHLQNRGERGKEKVTDETVVPVETRLAGIEAMLAEQQKLLLQLLAAQQQQGGRASGLVAGRVDV